MAKLLPYEDFDPERCLNCGTAFPATTSYCPDCGQRNRTHKRSLLVWVSEGLSSLFHLEGRTWNTLRDLPVPGRMPKRYLNGQRQRYVHPLRLLLFSSLVCFASIQLAFDEDEMSHEQGHQGMQDEEALPEPNISLSDLMSTRSGTDLLLAGYEPNQAREALQLARRSVAEDDSLDSLTRLATMKSVDSSIVELEREIERDSLSEFMGIRDAADLKDVMRDFDEIRAGFLSAERAEQLVKRLKEFDSSGRFTGTSLLDTFLQAFPRPTGNPLPDTMMMGDPVGLSLREIVTLSPRELVAASSLERWFNKLALRKMLQVKGEGQDFFNQYLLGNLSWVVLLFIPFFALGYWGLYRNRLPYYSQHLSYVAVNLSVGLLLATFTLLSTSSFPATRWLWSLLAPVFYLYIFIADIRVYHYVWWKTLLKQSALVFYGMFALAFVLMLWLLVALLLH